MTTQGNTLLQVAWGSLDLLSDYHGCMSFLLSTSTCCRRVVAFALKLLRQRADYRHVQISSQV
jgi:hypothetical protein